MKGKTWIHSQHLLYKFQFFRKSELFFLFRFFHYVNFNICCVMWTFIMWSQHLLYKFDSWSFFYRNLGLSNQIWNTKLKNLMRHCLSLTFCVIACNYYLNKTWLLFYLITFPTRRISINHVFANVRSEIEKTPWVLRILALNLVGG